jgi:hypothetical protein
LQVHAENGINILIMVDSSAADAPRFAGRAGANLAGFEGLGVGWAGSNRWIEERIE